MKILIATGIFTPEIGGPATYVPLIAEQFIALGHEVVVVSYSDRATYEQDKVLSYPIYRITRSNKLSNYWRYFRTLFKLASQYDVIYCFDHFSAGLPAALLSRILRKPLYIRVGGDFIWERYVEKESVTLTQYYERGLYHQDANRFKLINWIFEQCSGVIFTTEWQKNIFSQYYYGLANKKLFVIHNPIDDKLSIQRDENNISHDIIFAGRFINLNNIFNLIQAFVNWEQDVHKLVLIGDSSLSIKVKQLVKEKNYKNIVFLGKMSRSDLIDKMTKSWLVVFPSLSDISPNNMLDCLRGKIPFVSSREIGFDWLKNDIKTFDPQEPAEITQCFMDLDKPDNYIKYCNHLATIDYNYTYTDAAQDTLKIFKL